MGLPLWRVPHLPTPRTCLKLLWGRKLPLQRLGWTACWSWVAGLPPLGVRARPRPVLPPWLAAGCYTEVAAVVAAADGWGGLLVVRPTSEFLAGRRVCPAGGVGDDAVAAAAAADGDLPTSWSATAGRFDYRAWSLHRRLATASARTILDMLAVTVLATVVLAQRRAGLWGRNSEGRHALLGE